LYADHETTDEKGAEDLGGALGGEGLGDNLAGTHGTANIRIRSEHRGSRE